MKNLDLTFITNENGESLKERFEVLIKDTKLFDCLVGYFYTSGFHAIYKSLERTEQIRILIGISTSRQTHDLLKTAGSEISKLFSFLIMKQSRRSKVWWKRKWRILKITAQWKTGS